MDIQNVFRADSLSVGNILAAPGEGYYVPAYQRGFRWEPENVERLFEDITGGLLRFLDGELNAIVFIGSIIVIRDTGARTVHPYVRNHTPQTVQLIIDGQQRLSTLCVIAAVLAKWIREEMSKLGEDESDFWFADRSQQELATLQSLYSFDRNLGSPGHKRVYPRLIRALSDQWSVDPDNAKYASPIAKYLHEKIRSDYGTEPAIDVKVPAAIERVESYIEGLLIDGEPDDEGVRITLPAPEEIASRKLSDGAVALEKLLVCEVPTNFESSLESEVQKRLLRLLVFSRYLSDCVALTVVRPSSEDYAFDVFESLNTTGEPLNALETFKPQIVRHVGLDAFEGSEEHRHFVAIESFLGSGASSTRQRRLSSLLIAHCLSDEGVRLSGHLSDQRRYLRRSYDESSSNEDRRKFLDSLASMAAFQKNTWNAGQISSPAALDIPPGCEQAAIVLKVLRDSKHDITIAPLFRYWELLREGQISSTQFDEICLALAAFYLIWRTTRWKTKGIDDRYRSLMSGNTQKKRKPHARRKNAAGLTPDELRRILCSTLQDEGKICGLESYVALASSTPQYGNLPQAALRFFLLVAAHDTVVDTNSPGLTTKGNPGIRPTITWAEFSREFSIEHMAPQTPPDGTGYDKSIYDGSKAVNRLGNLTLLPLAINQSVSNRQWQDKRDIYGALCAETSEEAAQKLTNLDALSGASEALLASAGYLTHTRALANAPEILDADYITERGRRLATLAWDQLSLWLDWEKNSV